MILCLITVLFFSVTIQAQSQDSCIPNLCKNGGILRYDENRDPKIYCQCPWTHRGTVCQNSIVIDRCDSTRCIHGRCARVSFLARRCSCYLGYTGRNCDILRPACSSGRC